MKNKKRSKNFCSAFTLFKLIKIDAFFFGNERSFHASLVNKHNIFSR